MILHASYLTSYSYFLVFILRLLVFLVLVVMGVPHRRARSDGGRGVRLYLSPPYDGGGYSHERGLYATLPRRRDCS